MVKKLRCQVVSDDWVKVEADGGTVGITARSDGRDSHIYLTPSDAKKLRKQIKKALVEIDGEDEYAYGNPIVAEESPELIANVDLDVLRPQTGKQDEPAYTPHVGEVVEVYRNTVLHGFDIGEKVRVTISDGRVRAEHLDKHNSWAATPDIRPIQNWEPKEGEKVLIVDSTFVPVPGSKTMIGRFGVIKCEDDERLLVRLVSGEDAAIFNLSDLRPAE